MLFWKKPSRRKHWEMHPIDGKQLREAQLDYEMGEGERWTKEESKRTTCRRSLIQNVKMNRRPVLLFRAKDTWNIKKYSTSIIFNYISKQTNPTQPSIINPRKLFILFLLRDRRDCELAWLDHNKVFLWVHNVATLEKKKKKKTTIDARSWARTEYMPPL